VTDPSPASLVAEAFEAQRDRLRAVAYRVLGSHADAEDAVQEAWLRLARQDPAAIGNLAAWLTTVVGRISLDVLCSRQSRPEAPYGDGLPEPMVTIEDGPAPEEHAALADSVGVAMLVVLDSLGPSERVAFVLHDVFGVPFHEIGQILGRSADAAKMTASRARTKIRTTQRPAAAGRQQRAVVDAFRAAAFNGDFEGLLRVLDPDVRLTVDTPGGVVVTLGATRVAAGAQRFAGSVARHQAVLVDGRIGYISWREDGSPLSVIAFTVAGNQITGITVLADPARLASMHLDTLDGPGADPPVR
jgi:RNA polymerase sigma-70 factor (ECF subfamily)